MLRVSPFPWNLHYYSRGVSCFHIVSIESYFNSELSLKQPDISLSGLPLVHTSSGLSLTEQSGNYNTNSSLYLSTGVAPWHYPIEGQALLIARGLSGVSAWLFSPDIIIARVETVTRGRTERGRVGVSYPQFQNNICDRRAPEEGFFFPHNCFRESSFIMSSDFHNARESLGRNRCWFWGKLTNCCWTFTEHLNSSCMLLAFRL